VVKKRVTAKKSKRTKKAPQARKPAPRGDRSRLDLEPLQQHIRRRIKELEGGGVATTAARSGESNEETIARLRNALETLEDICFPTMDIPI
jgi:hypothetical protein